MIDKTKIYATNYQNQKFKNDRDMNKSISKIDKIKANINLIKELNNKTKKTDRKEINFLKYAVIPSQKIKSNNIPFDKLTEKKILEEGFQKPVLIRTQNNEIEFVGLSEKELSIAKTHKMLIPTIVIDQDNLFTNSYNISSISELKLFIKNKEDFYFTEKYIQDNNIINNEIEEIEKATNNFQTQEIKRIEVSNYYINNSKTRLKYANKHNLL